MLTTIFVHTDSQAVTTEIREMYARRYLLDAASQANVTLFKPGDPLGVCIFTADFWGSPTAGGTATAYHLLAQVSLSNSAISCLYTCYCCFLVLFLLASLTGSSELIVSARINHRKQRGMTATAGVGIRSILECDYAWGHESGGTLYKWDKAECSARK